MSRTSLTTALGSVVLAGCIAGVSFDPVGTAASVEGRWTVAGAAPSSARCAELSITHVRVRFYDGERTFDHPDLVFPCEQGAFDTRPERVVAGGTWTMQLLAIDNTTPVGESNVVGAGPLEMLDTGDARGHLVLTSVDFAPAPEP
ncbi:MAG TPA: hypothetical protein VIL20_09810 [Sandaracinaceae bacterium]